MAAFTKMTKDLSVEALAEDDFKRRRKAFIAEVDILGDKYQLLVNAVLQEQVATDAESKQKTVVYVPKIVVQDRKNLPTQSPDEPKKEPKAPKGTNDTPKSS